MRTKFLITTVGGFLFFVSGSRWTKAETGVEISGLVSQNDMSSQGTGLGVNVRYRYNDSMWPWRIGVDVFGQSQERDFVGGFVVDDSLTFGGQAVALARVISEPGFSIDVKLGLGAALRWSDSALGTLTTSTQPETDALLALVELGALVGIPVSSTWSIRTGLVLPVALELSPSSEEERSARLIKIGVARRVGNGVLFLDLDTGASFGFGGDGVKYRSFVTLGWQFSENDELGFFEIERKEKFEMERPINRPSKKLLVRTLISPIFFLAILVTCEDFAQARESQPDGVNTSALFHPKENGRSLFVSLGWRGSVIGNHLSHGPQFRVGMGFFGDRVRVGLRGFSRPGPINPKTFALDLPTGETYKGKPRLNLRSDADFIGLFVSPVIRSSLARNWEIELPLAVGTFIAGFYLQNEDRETPDGQRTSVWEDRLMDGRDASAALAAEFGITATYRRYKHLRPFVSAHYFHTFGYDAFLKDDYSGVSLAVGMQLGVFGERGK